MPCALAGLVIPALFALPVFAAPPRGETAALADSVRFESESITLTVTDSTAHVSGWYRFRNLSARARRVSLVYPFPIDSLHHDPHSIRVHVVVGPDTLPVATRSLGDLASVWLLLPLRPDTMTTWHVEYEQRIEASCARYILTSTAAWGRPLGRARYDIVHPSGFREVEVSLEPDSTANVDGWKRLSCSREDFMPAGDLWIRWRAPRRPACSGP